MSNKVRFVNQDKNYLVIKDEIEAAYFKVMARGDLNDRFHLRRFEENLADFVGAK